MPRLKTVTVKRFKRLGEVKIDLGTTTLLIGANNAGKSSVLQAIQFAVSLAQSAKLVGGVAWASGKYELSFSQTQLLYCPVSDAMTLSSGGELVEDAAQRVEITFLLEDGNSSTVSLRKGRNRNLKVAIEGQALGTQLQNLESPYSVYAPGLAGIPRVEHFMSAGAVEGEIVHAVLERLFKVLAVRGFPALGTPSFREGLAEVDVQRSVLLHIVQHKRRLADHPRASAFRLRTSAQQLVNQVIRLFRGLYQDALKTHRAGDLPAAVMRAPLQLPSGPALAALLRERGALSELPLVHPTLPFGGILDLIWSDKGESVITDFKTGQEKPEHLKQVAYYAVLWWRCSGGIPGKAEVRYPDRFVPVSIKEALLVEAEEELRRRVSAAATMLACVPTQAVLGEHCRLCDVRPFCERYWANRREHCPGRTPAPGQETSLDVEVTVVGEPSGSGFDAQTAEAVVFPVVFREDIALVHGPFAKGERLRILGCQLIEGGALELRPWTEVFHRGMS